MLSITIPGTEFYDDDKGEFVEVGTVQLELEHSLVALSKWESIWEKPFLSQDDKSDEETLSYIQCMALTDIPPEVLHKLSDKNFEDINSYISKKMSATWFAENKNEPRSREIITAEVIYYWMISFSIPFECENWNLNRLFTLVKVCNQKSAPAKKRSKADLAARNRQLNAERKAKYNTAG